MAAREHLLELADRSILVIGARGMLASDVIPRLRQRGVALVLADVRGDDGSGSGIETLDITDVKQVREIVSRVRPSWILNCAAYTAVDLAEREYDAAFSVNAQAVGHLARAAKEIDCTLVHISTDYVFGGDPRSGSGSASKPSGSMDGEGVRSTHLNEPLTEESPTRPCGIYGYSKWFGEEFLRAIIPNRHLLIRTSWLHGVNGPNFVDTMLRVGGERSSVKVVNDQYGSPTWAGWLGDVIVKLLQRDARGTFHATSHGNITWFEFAREIFRQAGLPIEVLPQTSIELDRPAPRPPYSVLDVSKLERTLGETCISWKDCIRHHLAVRPHEMRAQLGPGETRTEKGKGARP